MSGFFVCTQTTAYEMRISDWSSDVCSSGLTRWHEQRTLHGRRGTVSGVCAAIRCAGHRLSELRFVLCLNLVRYSLSVSFTTVEERCAERDAINRLISHDAPPAWSG